jgi:hypothetical protein
MIVKVDTSEMDDFLKKVGALAIRKTLDGSIRKATFLMENEAKRETPVDKGFLRNSYETSFRPLEGTLRNTREYAPYVHYGHRQTPGRYVPAIGKRLVASFVPGNPFMDRAEGRAIPMIADIFDSDLKELLDTLTS